MRRAALGSVLAIAVACGEPRPAGSADASTSSDATDAGNDSTSTGDATSDDGPHSTTDTGLAPACPSGDPTALAFVAPNPGTLVTDPLAAFPASLAEVGLYPQAPDLHVVVDGAIDYAPVWPLWSNGSDKHRFVVLPGGQVVDTSDPDRWTFPAGTLLFKTFTYDDGVDGCARPVETRVLRKSAAGTWDYAAYAWDRAGIDAALLDLDEPFAIAVTGPDGPFDHHVPARIECRACHESSPLEALGFERLQLSHGDRLAELYAAGVLSHAADPVTIDQPDDTTRRVLGSFHGNCVHCHNGSGGPSSSFDLRHDVALANTIDQPTQSSASASGIRIVPGSPEQSILFLAVSGQTDDPEVSAMPPIGVDVRDAEAVVLLRDFILALEN